MNFIFWGTPVFAKIILKKLIEAGEMPTALVCAPDKPVGRKQTLTPPETKVLAQKHGIPVFQPESLKNNPEFIRKINNLSPALFVVAAYGKILPKEIIDIPEKGSLNVHPSLLPKWRGPSPVQYTLLNGDEETGVTIMLVDEEMDHGPILASREITNSNIEIRNKSQISMSKITKPELEKRLAILGADMLIDTIPKWIAGNIEPQEQNHKKATYSKIITKKDGLIDWSESAKKIERMTRAFDPWPGAYTFWDRENKGRQKLTILEAKTGEAQDLSPGTVFQTENKQLAVACGKNSLTVKRLQLAGKSEVGARDFLNGYPNIIGETLSGQAS